MAILIITNAEGLFLASKWLTYAYAGGESKMKTFIIQVIDNNISLDWWKEIVKHFVKCGHSFEIRCWKDEQDEISCATKYGTLRNIGEEVAVNGDVTEDLLNELLSDEQRNKDNYNKMTRYFGISAKNSDYEISSEHYGTEVFVFTDDEKDIDFMEKLTSEYRECFSIDIQN